MSRSTLTHGDEDGAHGLTWSEPTTLACCWGGRGGDSVVGAPPVVGERLTVNRAALNSAPYSDYPSECGKRILE